MMRTFILLILTVGGIICNIYGQSDTIYFDKYWEITDKSGAAYYRLPLIPSGDGYLLRDFYISGARQFEGITLSPESDDYDSTVTWYYENGNIEQVVNFENGVKQGKALSYDLRGNLIGNGIYKDDLALEGTFGQIDGNLMQITTYSDGKLRQAEIFEMRPDSNIKFIDGVYSETEGAGEFSFYDQNGKLAGKIEMKDDAPYDGVYVDYNIDPIAVKLTLEISKGKYKSPIKYYYTNGSIKKLVYFKDEPDSPNKEVYYTPDGKAIDSLYMKDGSPEKGTQIKFFQTEKSAASDKIESISHYKNSELNGPYKEYYPNGALNYETNYTNSLEDGERISYDSLGNKLYSLTYVDGEPMNGTYSYNKNTTTYKDGVVIGKKQFYENGKPALILTAEGVETTYDKNGKELSHLVYKDGEPYEGKQVDFYYDEIDEERFYSKGFLIKETTYSNGRPSSTIGYYQDGNDSISITYYTSGKVQQEIYYLKDPSGSQYIFYDNSGNVIGKLTIDHDWIYNGDMYEFYDDHITSRILYVNDEVAGTWEYEGGQVITDIQNDGISTFNDVKNNKTYRCVYKEGEPFEGTMFEYDAYYGGITMLASYKNGELDGEYISYEYLENYDNPVASIFAPEYIYNYINGKMEGGSKKFHEGKLIAISNYSNDMLEGDYISYDLEGNKLSTLLYREDKPFEGVLYDYDYDYEELTSIQTYHNGYQDGEQKYYSEGELIRVEYYEEGALLKVISYLLDKEYVLTYANSEPFEGTQYDDYEYTLTEYKNGVLISIRGYPDSDLSTLQSLQVFTGDNYTKTTYFSTGKKREEFGYDDDDNRQGTALFYDLNGKVIAKGVYSDNDPVTGTFAFYSSYDETRYVILKSEKKIYEMTEYLEGEQGRKLQYSIPGSDDGSGSYELQNFISAAQTIFDDYTIYDGYY